MLAEQVISVLGCTWPSNGYGVKGVQWKVKADGILSVEANVEGLFISRHDFWVIYHLIFKYEVRH